MQERFNFSINESYSMVQKLWIWLIVGVGIGALIHNFVPQQAIEAVTSRTGIFTIPIVVLLGVPMSGSCASNCSDSSCIVSERYSNRHCLGFYDGNSRIKLS